MATNTEIIELHMRYPHWTANDIAAALDCDSGYVRATAKRKSLVLPLERQAMQTRHGIAQRLAAAVDGLLSIDPTTDPKTVAQIHRNAEMAMRAFERRGRAYE